MSEGKMGHVFRAKMSREERAKQFMPFAALKGYQEALYEKEKVVVPKMELSPEYLEELDEKTKMLKVNDMVTVVYFCNGEYLKITGRVSRLDKDAKILKVVQTRIPLDDILELNLI